MDKREFQKSLEAYYREKGKHPPPQTPVLAGKPISLHLLFERVTKLGGSYILSNEDRWQDILQGIYTATTSSGLHLPPSYVLMNIHTLTSADLLLLTYQY